MKNYTWIICFTALYQMNIFIFPFDPTSTFFTGVIWHPVYSDIPVYFSPSTCQTKQVSLYHDYKSIDKRSYIIMINLLFSIGPTLS